MHGLAHGSSCETRSMTTLWLVMQVFDLFDEVMLLSEGLVVFHGPREEVVPFFESMGFKWV